jgi:hypothetical protein
MEEQMTCFEFMTGIQEIVDRARADGDIAYVFFASNERNDAAEDIVNMSQEDAMILIHMLKSQFDLTMWNMLKIARMPALVPDRIKEDADG